MFHLRRYRVNLLPLAIGALGWLNLAASQAWANDEASAWGNFQAQVQAADPNLAQEAFLRSHTNSPSPQEIAQLMAGISTAEMGVMDQASEFQKQFPQSVHRNEVSRALAAMLGGNLGSKGLPIPRDRIGEVEACTRKFLADAPNDLQLNLVLFRVAACLPAAQGRALYTELSQEPTPEPARSMAKQALKDLGRLGKPLDITFEAVDGRKVSLADLKGKVVLIDFWSTDCAPCLREMPA